MPAKWYDSRHDSFCRIGSFVLNAFDGGFWRVLVHPQHTPEEKAIVLAQGTVGRSTEKATVLLAKAKAGAEQALFDLGNALVEELQ